MHPNLEDVRSATGRSVYRHLARIADDAGRVTATDDEIAKSLNRCRRTVTYALRELRLAELIRSELHGDSGTKRTIILLGDWARP
jgi:CRP-like cAMP-binding protein